MSSSPTFESIKRRLKVPVIQAPMFLVSGPEMVIAACHSGVIGSFPASNARTVEDLEQWYCTINQQVTKDHAPWAANVIVHKSNPRAEQELQLIYKYQPEIIITALGSPTSVIEEAHKYGGLVFADVGSPRHAKRAVEAGADGLIILCAGAGGYTGTLSPFAFVEEVRRFFDGPLVVSGSINTGRNVRAVEVMGADLAYMGTQYLATEESMASSEYKEMLVNATSADILVSDRVTGQVASWLVPSLIANGFDPDNLPEKCEFDFSSMLDVKKWKALWSAGHGVSQVTAVRSIEDVTRQIEKEYQNAIEAERSFLHLLQSS